MIDKQYAYFLNGHSPDDGLVKLCIEDVAKSGLSPETLEKTEVRIFSGNKDSLKDRLGFASINSQDILQHCRLIEFPYFNERSETIPYRYKLIPSLTDKDGGEIKYLHPIGKPAVPYILPEVWQIKEKTNKPIWITEGEKKSLTLIQHGRHAIALSGVWNFRAGKNSDLGGDKNLWHEMQSFEWRGRTVYLAFDMDLWINPKVRQALYELAFKLFEKGAIVKVVTWKDAI